MSLRSRLAISAAVAVALAVIGVSAVAYVMAKRELIGQVDESLADRVAAVAPVAGRVRALGDFGMGRGGFRGGGIVVPRGSFDELYGQIVEGDGTVVTAPETELVLPVEDEDIAVASGLVRTATYRDVTVDGVHLRMITAPLPPVGALQLARPLTEVDATLSGLAAVLAVVGLVGVGVAGGAGMVVARSALQPVERLTDAAEHVADTQELAARIDIDRDDEIGRLAAAFNAMLGALEQSRAQQRRLVHDASHELRTPLTALRTNIEVLARQPDMTEDQRAELMVDVASELEELGNLVAELVELATDARAADEPKVAVRLDQLIARVVERARRRTGRTIGIDAEPVIVRVRPSQVERALGNLIENAHKWSPEGEKIEVVARGDRIAVVDHGPGIAPEDRSHVFDRFYRAPAARTMPGSGLGLSIVAEIAAAHGGSVFVEETDGGGATVGFTLPEVSSSS